MSDANGVEAVKECQQEPCKTIYRRAKANVITMPVYLNEIRSKTERKKSEDGM